MTPKLIAISGPLTKSEFSLDSQVTLGARSDNTISLDDPAVSPHHCVIAFSEGQLTLKDLDSHSGTFVNGIPVKQQRLIKPGDELTVGNSVFVVAAQDSEAIFAARKLVEAEPSQPATLQFQSAEFLTLDPNSLASLPQSARLERNLGVLLQICRVIGSLRDEESLPWLLLGAIFDVIPAARGAILLTEANSCEIRAQVSWDRVLGPDHLVNIDRGIVQRVIEDGVSLLDGGGGHRSATSSDSVENLSRPALLSVPLTLKNKQLGLVYLESGEPSTTFTQDDFQLLTAIAALAVVALENARQLELLGNENQRLRAAATLTHGMVGNSPRMREVYQFIERVAPTDSTVLIYGESGTGKELAAAAIHKNSLRKNQPYVALNCAAITESLLESELFGHEKGAFTSAIGQKKGFLEVAEGGTIFLDEIGELSLVLQAKLLRVLQEREFVRVGGTRPIKINVRFVAATNKDLQTAAREGKFRSDLFHRLNVIPLNIPPLREHPEDILALAEYFCARHARGCNRNVLGISREAMTCLAQYDWPGNIRELENALERAVVIGSSDRILLEDLPETILETARSTPQVPAKYHQAVRNLKKQLILSSLDQAGGSVTEAAKLLGVHANYLHRLMRNFDLRPMAKKQTAD